MVQERDLQWLKIKSIFFFNFSYNSDDEGDSSPTESKQTGAKDDYTFITVENEKGELK